MDSNNDATPIFKYISGNGLLSLDDISDYIMEKQETRKMNYQYHKFQYCKAKKGNRDKLSDFDLDCIVRTYVNLYPKELLLKRATFYANRNVLPFRLISNKKSAEDDLVFRAYRKAINVEQKVFDEIVDNIIRTVNEEFEDSADVPTDDVYNKADDSYLNMLAFLHKVLYKKNIRWFLIVTDHTPNEEQEKIIYNYVNDKSSTESNEDKKEIQNSEDNMMNNKSENRKVCFYLGFNYGDTYDTYIINPFAYLENDTLSEIDDGFETIKVLLNNINPKLDEKMGRKCYCCYINRDKIKLNTNNRHVINENAIDWIPISSEHLYEIITPLNEEILSMETYRKKPFPFDCNRIPTTDYIFIEIDNSIFGPFSWELNSGTRITIEPKTNETTKSYLIFSTEKEQVSNNIYSFQVMQHRDSERTFLFVKPNDLIKSFKEYDFIDDAALKDLVSIKTLDLDFTRSEKKRIEEKINALSGSSLSEERKNRFLNLFETSNRTEEEKRALFIEIFKHEIVDDEFWKHENVSIMIDRILEVINGDEDAKGKMVSLLDSQNFFDDEKRKRDSLIDELDALIESKKEEIEKLNSQKEEIQIYEINDDIEAKRKDLEQLKQKCDELQKKYTLGEEFIAWESAINTRKSILEESIKNLENQITGFESRAKTAISDAYAQVAFNDVLSDAIVVKANEFRAKQSSQMVQRYFATPSADYAIKYNNVKELIEHLRTSIGRYENNDIANVLMCVSQGFLTVFAGKPGTGKTSLCERLSRAMGLERQNNTETRFVEVAVEKGWTSKRDFIGYYNPITRSFDKVNKDVYSALKCLDSEVKENNYTFPFFILLDEANLSSMEHYWADFMKVCDFDNNQFINIGEQTNCQISKTLRFLATINYDTTTETLSPRLLDRAWIIDVDSDVDYDNITDKQMDYSEAIVSYSDLEKYFGAGKILSDEIINKISDDTKMNLNSIYDKFSNFIILSPRVRKAVLKYYYFATSNNIFEKQSDGISTDTIALDYAVSQKVLPLIREFDNDNGIVKKSLEELEKQFKTLRMNKCTAIIRQILNNGYNGYYNYFNR